jgi:hypothetical protein
MLRKFLIERAKIAMDQRIETQHLPKSDPRAIPVRVLSDRNLKMSFISGAHNSCTQNGKQSQTQLTSSRFDHRLNPFICNLPRSGTQKSPGESPRDYFFDPPS